MASWIYTQLNHYKKNKQIMKKEKIRKSWEEFVNDDKYKVNNNNRKKKKY